MKKYVSLLALILVGAGAALADGSGDKSDAALKYARQEFARCVKAMTGKAPPELKFSAADAKEGLGPDGFRVIAKNGAIEIRSEQGRGALYGVYDVLERFGGAGFYTRECEVLPKREKFTVPDGTDYSERPAFGDRTAYWYDAMRDTDFAAKLRLNGSSHSPAARHGGLEYRFVPDYWLCHTFKTIMPVEEFAKEHPEYYGLVKGKRYFAGEDWQLCLTNPDVLRIVTERTLAQLRAHPDARYIGLSQNDGWWDGGTRCHCENCTKVNEEEGSNAGTNVRFINAVADAVAKEFPDKIVETLAYLFTRKPTKTAYRDNVMPCLCSIECDFKYPIDGGKFKENVSFCEDLKGWKKLTKQLYIWDYNTQYGCYPLPFPNLRVLGPNLRLFRDAGACGVFSQGAGYGRCSGLGDLKTWMLAKLMWNPDLDTDKLIDEFVNACYGAAAKEVRAYIDELHAIDFGDGTDGKPPFDTNVTAADARLKDEFLDRAEAHWRKGEKLLAGDPVRLQALREAAFSTRYVIFSRLFDEKRPLKEYFATRDPSRFNRVTPRQREILDSLRLTMQNAGRIAFYGGGHDAEREMRRILRACEDTAKMAPSVRTSIPLRDLGYDPFIVKRVDDRRAFGDLSASIKPTASGWVLRQNLGAVAFDEDTDYVLRLQVKAKRLAGAGDGDAFSFGYFDTTSGTCGEVTRAKASETGEQGAWYELPARKLSDGLQLWFAPGEDAAKTLESLEVQNIEIIAVGDR